MEKATLVLVTVTSLEGAGAQESRVFGVVAEYADVVARVVAAMGTTLPTEQPEKPALFAIEVLADLMVAALGVRPSAKEMDLHQARVAVALESISHGDDPLVVDEATDLPSEQKALEL